VGGRARYLALNLKAVSTRTREPPWPKFKTVIEYRNI
jgi:hypothetical protein